MRFTVAWREAAEGVLADMWTTAKDREAVTEAANAIDGRLARNPSQLGESRWGRTRVLFVPPLAVYFDVSEDDRLVSVWAIWGRRRCKASVEQ